jgi:hypothetical protein
MTSEVRVIVVLVGRATCLPYGAGTSGNWRTTTVNKALYLLEEPLLAPTLSAPAAARAFIQETCRSWEPALPDNTLVDRACC